MREKDAHGNVQLSGTGALADLLCEEVKEKLGIKRVRGDTFGYLQRSFVGCVSSESTSARRAKSARRPCNTRCGGAKNGSVAIKRVGDYAVDYPLIPLETVAGKTRVMEDEFINADGNGVTPAFIDYLRPLVGDMPRGRAAAGGEGREGDIGSRARNHRGVAPRAVLAPRASFQRFRRQKLSLRHVSASAGRRTGRRRRDAFPRGAKSVRESSLFKALQRQFHPAAAG